MGIFGKRSITAHDAAARFIIENMRHSAGAWPKVRDELRPVLQESLTRRPDLLSDTTTAFYFAVARLACEMQAVRNLLPAELAERVVNAVKAAVRLTDDTTEAEPILSVIDDRWQHFASEGSNPTYAIGMTIFECLGLDETIEVEGKELPNPFVVMALSAIPLQMGLGWWKAFLAKDTIK